MELRSNGCSSFLSATMMASGVRHHDGPILSLLGSFTLAMGVVCLDVPHSLIIYAQLHQPRGFV